MCLGINAICPSDTICFEKSLFFFIFLKKMRSNLKYNDTLT